MIKSLLDSETDEPGKGSARSTSGVTSGSFLDLKVAETPTESLDPFAITDLHQIAQPSTSEPATGSNAFENGAATNKPVYTPEYLAPTGAETVRMSGLAWSAGIVFFGSVGLMMIFGWLVDTVLGSSPWGIVGGIVLGSVIGFVQLIRINTQLLKISSSAPRSLLEQAAAAEKLPIPTPNASESDETVEVLQENPAKPAAEHDESTLSH